MKPEKAVKKEMGYHLAASNRNGTMRYIMAHKVLPGQEGAHCLSENRLIIRFQG